MQKNDLKKVQTCLLRRFTFQRSRKGNARPARDLDLSKTNRPSKHRLGSSLENQHLGADSTDEERVRWRNRNHLLCIEVISNHSQRKMNRTNITKQKNMYPRLVQRNRNNNTKINIKIWCLIGKLNAPDNKARISQHLFEDQLRLIRKRKLSKGARIHHYSFED